MKNLGKELTFRCAEKTSLTHCVGILHIIWFVPKQTKFPFKNKTGQAK